MINKVKLFKGFLVLLAVVTLFAITGKFVFASEEAPHQESAHDSIASTDHTENHEGGEEKFNAGKFIIDHVTDKYDWHLWGPHDGGVSIPLPLILYTEGQGLDIFLSSNFHHGTESYKGYTLNHEGHIEREDKAEFLDFSITKTVTEILIASFLLLWIFISAAKAYTRRVGQAPKGLQSFVEPIILFVRDDIAKASIGQKQYARFVPFLLTIFFFIFFNNFLGLIPIFPGGANVTGNIAVTLVLAF